jgi:hypothetical protein
VAAEEAEFRPAMGRNSEQPRPGRPTTAGSVRNVQQRTGIDKATMQRAEDHLAAVAKYPALGSPDASQRQALELAKSVKNRLLENALAQGAQGLEATSAHVAEVSRHRHYCDY